MGDHILSYRCSKKAQSNLILGPKYGFTASTAFSGKFQLNFVCCLFIVLFVTA